MERLTNITLESIKRIIQDNNILCWGCGNQGKRWAMYMNNWKLSDHLLGYIDNNLSKIGTTYECHGREYHIYSFNEAEDEFDSATILLISCLDYESVYKQLEECGCKFARVISLAEIAQAQLLVSDYPEVVKESEEELIPRIIHYAWLGGEKPDFIKRNIEGWHKLCPDYEIIEWNEHNYDVTKNKYMYQAYQKKKWGFVSDYLRLDVVYQQGGIYLDTDIEMIKRPDELLHQRCFGCSDATFTMNLGSGFGARPRCKIIRNLRDYYDNVSFVGEDGSIDNTSCNTHSFRVLEQRKYIITDNLQRIGEMNIYPMIFQGAAQYTRTRKVTEKTFWVHYGSISWMDDAVARKIMERLPA
jgi:hypothetical protein